MGPSDYVPWLNDQKICFLRIEGKKFGGIPFNLEARLSVEDSPNSAGSMIDAIRACKLALDYGHSGTVLSVSAYLMKHPMVQLTDEKARNAMEQFIATGRDILSDRKTNKEFAVV